MKLVVDRHSKMVERRKMTRNMLLQQKTIKKRKQDEYDRNKQRKKLPLKKHCALAEVKTSLTTV